MIHNILNKSISDYKEKYNSIKKEIDSINDGRFELELEIYDKKELMEDLKEERKGHYSNLPSWTEILHPLAKSLLKYFPGRNYEISGPCGIGARAYLAFYKIDTEQGKEDINDDRIYFTFEANLEEEKLQVADYSIDTERFKEGTLGYINGLNHPSVDVPDTAEELMKFSSKE